MDLTNTPEQKLTECDEGLAMEDKTKRLKRNAGKGRKGNPRALLVGMEIGVDT